VSLLKNVGNALLFSYNDGVARQRGTVGEAPKTVNSEAYQKLRMRINEELLAAGFLLRDESFELPEGEAKETYRKLHQEQRTEKLLASQKVIRTWEDAFITSVAKPEEIDLKKIVPRIRAIETEQDRGIFNYASLTWSVPVSKGFGRRTYFLVEDEQNNKLIGIFALGDPVYNLGVRDKAIGWSQEQKAKRLYNVFDAFVCGSIDPYRKILGGKLVAMLTTSQEVVDKLQNKYEGTVTHISEEVKDSRPALITVTSALGRSSIYNRLKFEDRYVLKSHGYTKGYGHFHFSPSLYNDLLEIAKEHPRYSGTAFGAGANWKIRTLRQALSLIGVSASYMQHGLTREVFLGELAPESMAFLRGETNELGYFSNSIREMANFWKERWIYPRGTIKEQISSFVPDSLRISAEMGIERELTIF